MSICLKDFGVVCAIGQSKQEVFDSLLANKSGLRIDHDFPIEEPQFVGRVEFDPATISESIDTHNNQLAYLAYQQIQSTLSPLFEKYGHDRIAVVIGTSTAGTLEAEQARKELLKQHTFPESFHYQVQEMAAPSQFIANLCSAKGPVYSISTACSSSGKALVSAQALLDAHLADVVIAGGVDSLTRLTINGFNALASISSSTCSPFSANRDGINIGEAAALFVMTKDNDGIQLLGTGETSDAYHISAPSPDGEGAYKAMKMALDNAHLKGEEIDYVNLHGTGTIKNDGMEAKAMHDACGSRVLCSSTKHLTGHTLGAAGALEIGFCWLLLSDYNNQGLVPMNKANTIKDPILADISLCDGRFVENINYCMSNSFAFGGNNFSAVIGKHHE